MIRPTIAAIIVALASPIFALSPPERIHLIPPYTKKKSEITAAIIIIATMMFRMVLPMLLACSLQRLSNCPAGQKSTAKLGRGSVRVNKARKESRAKIRFIKL